MQNFGNSTYATALETKHSVPSLTFVTVGEVNDLVARVMDIADRLCGPVPSFAAGNGSVAPAAGELGRMRTALRDTRDALTTANEALNRIEREMF